MNTQEQNPGKLLQQLPKVDAPIGLEQRLRKRIAAGEGKSLQPLSTRRSTTPWLQYSIAASVILALLAGYSVYRNQSASHPDANPQNAANGIPEQSTPVVSTKPADTPMQATNAGQTPEKREQLLKSSSLVDKSTGNTHRDDPANVMALKLTGGTAMEHTVPRPAEYGDARQGYAQTASQTYGPPVPYGVVQSRTYPTVEMQSRIVPEPQKNSATEKSGKEKTARKLRKTKIADSSSTRP